MREGVDNLTTCDASSACSVCFVVLVVILVCVILTDDVDLLSPLKGFDWF